MENAYHAYAARAGHKDTPPSKTTDARGNSLGRDATNEGKAYKR